MPGIAKESTFGKGGGLDGGPAPTLADLTARLVAFRDERDWAQFHTAKNLMVSLALEAAELLELTQWKTDQQVEAALAADPAMKDRLREECADVFLYLLLLCERTGIDLAAAAAAKIETNAAKYPAEKARGTCLKYNELP
ncbi:MazG-like family protein [Magnetospirillum sp. UT-4]|uniref:MazG-like family protein n=1 Tax=Magnetospirillum sp. UT-4 TaxID=2681467 RepID=UPI00137CDF70|nr:MazG-like family protein [Magnetospirillum sp. UT-4]CAA7613931.1 putative pyrophosphatase [Magnetospirillum sp. UT-4]